MIATNAEFNGIQFKDVGLAIVTFNSEKSGVVDSSGGEITPNTSKPMNQSKWNFHGSHYEQPLSFSFQIAKLDLKHPMQSPITSYEKAYYKRWLCRKDGYKLLRILEDGYEDIYLNAMISLKWMEYGGETYGAELTVTCDAPFGYSPIHTFETALSSGNSFEIYNDSDEIGAIVPKQIEIQILSDGTFQLHNAMCEKYVVNYENLSNDMVIKNCTAGETIIINGDTKQIKTNVSSHDIVNDFNFVYPKLINLDETYQIPSAEYKTLSDRRINTFTMMGNCNCNISMAYRTIRTAVM